MILLHTTKHFYNHNELFFASKQVLSLDESTNVGRISKQWTGLAREAFTDADNFGISFPMDLDVKIKAVLFGACFLIVSNNTLLLYINILLAVPVCICLILLYKLCVFQHSELSAVILLL